MLNQDLSTGFKDKIVLKDLRELVEATEKWDEDLTVEVYASPRIDQREGPTYKISVRNG